MSEPGGPAAPVDPAGGPAPRAGAPGGGATAARAPQRRVRGGGTVGDMVRSLALILGIVAVVLVLVPRPSGETVRTVDWRPVAQQAAGSATYDVLVPAGLPEDWRSTSARVDRAPGEGGSVAWTIGFVTPEDDYAATGQSDGDAAVFVEDLTKQGAATGTVEVGGATWERRERDLAGEPRRSLVRELDGSTVLVTGTASWAELEVLAGSLRPQA
ncbi:DUF4245 domain-containing protein [Vallicoccus soli]|nr:DUF4245 domain-containing protein [Vallicoccus soli]